SPISSTPLCSSFSFYLRPPPPRSTLFPYTTLFRSSSARDLEPARERGADRGAGARRPAVLLRRAGGLRLLVRPELGPRESDHVPRAREPRVPADRRLRLRGGSAGIFLLLGERCA